MQNACNVAAHESTKTTERVLAGVTDEMKAIGKRLWALRYALGYDGRQMSAFCRWVGIPNTSQWHQYERGGKRISIDEALKVSIRTGATLDWIYKGDDWLWTLPGRLSDLLPEAVERVEKEEDERIQKEAAAEMEAKKARGENGVH